MTNIAYPAVRRVVIDIGRFTHLNPHRRALFWRAVITAGIATMVATGGVVGTASADHPAPRGEEECRHWAPHPHPYIRVVAEDNSFDAHCLEAPANKKFRIYLENHDSDEHNISIYSADPEKDKKAEQLYEGEAVKGKGSRSDWPPRADYAIDALPPGEYFFRDDKVKEMNGVILVSEEKKD